MPDTHSQNDSACIGHEPCPECPSSDGFAVYDDGHGHCFVCGHHTKGEETYRATHKARPKVSGLVDPGDCKPLKARGITLTTCEKFGYTFSKHRGKTVQVAPYYDAQGHLIGQKLRGKDKTFESTGDLKSATFFGQHLWPSKGRRVVITEGEIDAMSLSQAQGNKWPVVSVPTGCKGAKKAVQKNLEWLEGFDEVVFMFDSDEPGKAAVAECVPLLSPGKAKVCYTPEPFKDANDMLKAGKTAELTKLPWDAKLYKPDGVVSYGDLKERIYKEPEWGLSYPWETLTKLTYGMRTGELVAVGAGTGTGKSDFFKEVIEHLVTEHGQTVGCLFLEESVSDTAKSLMSKFAGKLFHLPDSEYSPEEFDAAYEQLANDNKVHFFDHYGATDWETIKSRIRFMVVSLGCKYIFLDHITMMVYGDDDERKELDEIMEGLTALKSELDVNIHFVSHLTSPSDGSSHEEGARVKASQFRGSRSIGQCSSFMIGLERDQQKKKSPTTVRILKDRFSGRATGNKFGLGYNETTGQLHETSLDVEPEDFEKDSDLF